MTAGFHPSSSPRASLEASLGSVVRSDESAGKARCRVRPTEILTSPASNRCGFATFSLATPTTNSDESLSDVTAKKLCNRRPTDGELTSCDTKEVRISRAGDVQLQLDSVESSDKE